MFQLYNANPIEKRGQDCTVRAISQVMGTSWENVYIGLCAYGLKFYDMPSANHIWGAYLLDHGFTREIIPNTCPNCYTVADFANDHPKGSYILALSGHVVACIDGCVIDSWDSTNEVPIYYWERKDVQQLLPADR